MSTFRIVYTVDGPALVFVCQAESEGEAFELFDAFADRSDEYFEFVGITELAL